MRAFVKARNAFAKVRRVGGPVLRCFGLIWLSFSVTSGFVTGVQAQTAGYNPHLFASGIGTLFAAACAGLALLVYRNRSLCRQMRLLEERVEELADRNWELKESEERARSFIEAQGDVIVRRDSDGRITYANDAFCALIGRSRNSLLGAAVALPVVAQGAATTLPDGTRVHDQKIDGTDGARWIAWREVTVRNDRSGTEIQSVGRDVTGRAQSEQALADARDQAADFRAGCHGHLCAACVGRECDRRRSPRKARLPRRFDIQTVRLRRHLLDERDGGREAAGDRRDTNCQVCVVPIVTQRTQLAAPRKARANRGGIHEQIPDVRGGRREAIRGGDFHGGRTAVLEGESPDVRRWSGCGRAGNRRRALAPSASRASTARTAPIPAAG
jgi:PAS domain S-box-containing protein